MIMECNKEDRFPFNVGDNVFARVKGYPAWPAIIKNVVENSRKKLKYEVLFYGSDQKATCNPEALFSYHLFKDKFGSLNIRSKHFNRALQLIADAETEASDTSLGKPIIEKSRVIENYPKRARIQLEKCDKDEQKDDNVTDIAEQELSKQNEKPVITEQTSSSKVKKLHVTDDNMTVTKLTKKKSRPVPYDRRVFKARTMCGVDPRIHWEQINEEESIKNVEEKNETMKVTKEISDTNTFAESDKKAKDIKRKEKQDTKAFKSGDNVFAKVRGHSPWPAIIIDHIGSKTPYQKYRVRFYGTSETAVCKITDIFHYKIYKDKYGIPKNKTKVFQLAISEIENA